MDWMHRDDVNSAAFAILVLAIIFLLAGLDGVH